MISKDFSCKSGSNDAVAFASTTICALGKALFAITALDNTHMLDTNPHSSTTSYPLSLR